MALDTTRVSLIARIKDRGDSAAWREFDALYRPMLRRFALGRGLNETEAEDVVQFCMTAISEHIGDFNYDPAKGRFKGWLRTLVNNCVRNRARREDAAQARSGELERVPDAQPTPEELFDRIWMGEHVRYCLGQLKGEVEPATYQAFVSHVIDEKPVERVCEELKMTPNQVYVIKWRLTRKLAEKMSGLLGEAE